MLKLSFLSSVILLISIKSTAQQRADTVVLGVFNDVYAIWDTTNLQYAKKLSDGIRGDTCLIFGSLRSATGSIWVKVATIDTIGYTMAEFISYDKTKVGPLKNNTTNYSVTEYIKGNRIEWLAKKGILQGKRAAEREKNKEEFRKFIGKNDLFITLYSFPETEYLRYPGFKVSIVNSNQSKIIKYIWFTLTAYNPVDDIVGTKTFQAIGPVDPLKTADYNFEIAFRSSVVDNCKITGIKIQYMDKSVISFNKSQVESILIRSKVFLSYVENSNF